LPQASIRLNTRVTEVKAKAVTLASGETLDAAAVVVAVEGPAAAQLLGGDIAASGHGVTCLYYAAPTPPLEQPILVLNGESQGPINNLCVPTAVAPSYGPPEQALVSVTVLGVPSDLLQLEAEVRQQLKTWYGAQVDAWRQLRIYTIPYALPQQNPPALAIPARPVRWQPGIYLCGDHRDTASIQGAMVSGRRAAEALIADRA
jgi:predicted NAD/FAD-dependent oxidoreductase